MSTESNFMRMRWLFFALGAAAGAWALVIQSGRPTPGTCTSIRQITGDTAAGCATPGTLWAALGIMAVFLLMWAAAMLARKS